MIPGELKSSTPKTSNGSGGTAVKMLAGIGLLVVVSWGLLAISMARNPEY